MSMERRDRVRRQAILIVGILVLAAIANAPLLGGEASEGDLYQDVQLPAPALDEKSSSEGAFGPYQNVVVAQVDPMVVARWDEGRGGLSAGGDPTTIAMESGSGGSSLSNARVRGGALSGGGGTGGFEVESIAHGNQLPIWWVLGDDDDDDDHDYSGYAGNGDEGGNSEDPTAPDPSVPEPSAFLVFALGAGVLSRFTRR